MVNSIINIREYQRTDRSIIFYIHKIASAESHAFLGKKNIADEQKIMEESISAMESLIPPQKVKYVAVKCVVIERDGRVCGFASFMSETAMSAFFIKKNLQGQGLGSDLMRHIQSEKSKITLAVYEENSKAIDFYRKHSFYNSEPKNNNGHKYIEMNWERQF